MNLRILVAALLFGLAPLASAQDTAQDPAPDAAPPAAGELALVTGSVTLAGEPAKALKTGDKIREGQTLNVGANSYASLKFADGGRVLLRPNTEFTVESYKYEAPAPAVAAGAPPASAVGTAFFRLVRGGFRAISGLIGKGDPQAYKVTTPVATIGIRGTDYEVELCAGDCPSQAQAGLGTMVAASAQLAQTDVPPEPAGGPAAGGVILATHEGSIEATTAGGATFRVDAGQVGVMLAGGQTFMLPAVPDQLLINPAPSPEGCQ
jgi:hypothetical protein